MLEEELDDWHRIYVPPKPKHDFGRELLGQTVLDAGAGCGETAQFFLLHGAAHVVCIEGSPDAVDHLRRNFGSNPKVTIVPRFVDFTKLDIEGSEEWLSVETHFPTRFRKIHRNPHAPDVNTYRVERAKLRLTQRLRHLGEPLHHIRIGVAHEIRIILNRIGV
jgi:SAM-dependent methyltransferase